MAEKALDGVKVLDLTQHIAGTYATKLFAGFGADVIKVEKPGRGDVTRWMGPFCHDEVHPEKSGLFLYLNMGKRGITLNLKSPMGKETFLEMVKRADIVVESFRPGVMASFGLSYEALQRINPDLVMGSISNFGQTGSYRNFKASPLILYGMGSQMHSAGLAEREPVKDGETLCLYQAGVAAAVGILGAFLGRVFQGVGQYVDISLQEMLTAPFPERKSTLLIAYQYRGDEQPRLPAFEAGYPVGTYPCADGYFAVYGGRGYWNRVVEMLGKPEFLKDPKWKEPTAQSDPELKAEFLNFWLDWVMQRTKTEVMEIAQANRLPLAGILDIAEVATHPHYNQRGFFMEIEHSIVGKLKYPGRPFVMGETPFQIDRAAPLLGQHNEEIYGELGFSKEDLVHLREQGVI